MHLLALTLIALLTLPYHSIAQEPQPATTDAPFSITFESIRLTHTGFIVTVSYVNTTLLALPSLTRELDLIPRLLNATYQLVRVPLDRSKYADSFPKRN